MKSGRTALVLLFAAAVVFYSRGLLPGRVLLPLDILCTYSPWDATAACAGRVATNRVLSDQVTAFYPWREVARRNGISGIGWNPYSFAGSPLSGNGQSALLFPPNWLHFVLPPSWSYVLLAIFRTALALLFTLLLARRQMSTAAAALAATSYSFSYTFVFWLGYPIGDAMSLIPALFWAADARRWLALGAFTALQLYTGQPQTSLVTFLALGVVLLWQRLPPRQLLYATAAGAAGLVAAFPQLVPLWRYLNQSAAAYYRAQFMPLFYSPHTLIDFLTPAFFGTSSPQYWWGSNEGGYFGLLAALLIAAWLVSEPKHALRNPYFWMFVTSVALVHRLPPFGWVLKLPLLRTMYVTKFWPLAAFGAAMAAGFALDAFIAGRVRLRAVYAAAGVFAAAVTAVALYFRGFVSALSLGRYEAGVLAVFAASLAASVFLLRFRPAMAAALLFAESFVYLGVYNPAADARLLYPPTGLIEFLKKDTERARFWGDGVLPPNTAAVFGIEDARGYDAITPLKYFRYLAAVDATFPDLLSRLQLDGGQITRATLFERDRFLRPLAHWGEPFREFLRNVYYWNDRITRLDRPALFDLLNVKYYAVPKGGRLPDGAGEWRIVYSAEVDVYENPRRLPRAFVAGAWEFASSDEDALSRIRRADFDPRRTAVICCGTQPGVAAFDGYRPAQIVRYTAGEVVVRANGPGALVLADANMPGWRAFPFPVYSADYLFRAVLLPEGAHDVRFVYGMF